MYVGTYVRMLQFGCAMDALYMIQPHTTCTEIRSMYTSFVYVQCRKYVNFVNKIYLYIHV